MPHGMCPDCTGPGKRLTLVEDRLFDPERTLRDGGLTFSQFAAGWQNVLYTQHPKLDPDKKLKDFPDEEWTILKYGEDENTVITMLGNGAGGTYKVDYVGVVPRFQRLYMNRDISRLKKGLQQEITKCDIKFGLTGVIFHLYKSRKDGNDRNNFFIMRTTAPEEENEYAEESHIRRF